jgi:protein required for attachment to host cells
MRRACIAIVDAARARIFTYDGTDGPGGYDPMLQEEHDLVNPGRRGHDLFSTTKRMPRGGGSTDDHRDAHFDQLERNFAKQIVGEVDRIARERGFTHVVVVTTPRMLGELRKLDAALHRVELALEYVVRDLAQLTPTQIHDHLAQLQLIAPRRRMAFGTR